MVPLSLFYVLLTVPVLDFSDDTKNITAKTGEDVLLHCQGPRGADIPLIVWSRPDLGSDKYVFSRNGNHTNGNYQLPSYSGRVTLSDPEMKDGDVSVVLKNVSANDTGTYECLVGIKKGEEPKVYSTFQLKVEDPAAEDKEGYRRLVVGLSVAGGLIALSIVCFISCCIILKRRNRLKKSNSYNKVPAERADGVTGPFAPVV
ncbi:sodium channel subunit beta-2-like [Perca fluviatilis]|uniref:sodium channel subunit beta-2-like n=1 Tax=Perca fluviatilis TaxID=8168 RepID=UPI0019649781|nr:sodium channel subunit beta-2-like [Perca fluviatilis]